MSTKKIILITIFFALSIAGISDAVRYLKPAKDDKEIVLPAKTFSIPAAKKIILVYNAWGGIYPGIADIIYKEFSCFLPMQFMLHQFWHVWDERRMETFS